MLFDFNIFAIKGMEVNMDESNSKMKKRILKISIILFSFLIICTFVSRTIYTMLLPSVEVTLTQMGSLSTWTSFTGKVSYSNEYELFASSDFKVKEVLVKNGSHVIAGDSLLKVDTKGLDVERKRLELKILGIKNKLKSNSLPELSKQEVELQLEIAKQELESFKISNPINRELEEQKLEMAIKQLEGQGDEYALQLQIARDELERYRSEGGGYDKAEEVKLRKTIYALQRKLANGNSLTDAEKEQIQKELDDAQDSLQALLNAYPTYDPIQEQRLRLELIRAYNNLTQDGLTETDEIQMGIKLEMAQKELNAFRATTGVDSAITEHQLELQILKLQNQLKQEQPQVNKAEVMLELEIAQLEMKSFNESFPLDGVIKAKSDGIITEINVKNGDSVTSGQSIVSFASNDSKQCVKWSIPYQTGSEFGSDSVVSLALPKPKTGGKNKFSSKSTSVKTAVNTKEFDEETNSLIFTALFESEEPIEDGVSVNVKIQKASEQYDKIVPSSCLKEINGEYVVYVVDTRQGLFSKESYVREVKVDLLEKNSIQAAISSNDIYSSTDIVHFATKSIYDNSVVNVINPR